MLDAKLVIVGGANFAQEYHLTLPATMGRGKENNIPLAHPLVSRRHCELSEEGGRLCVRDLGSLNGTFIGNQPVEGVSPIEPGQLLTIGTVTFRAIYNGFKLDASDEGDVLGEAEFAGGRNMGNLGPAERAGLTMTRPATSAAAEPLKAALAETNAGLDTETTAPSLQETERLPSKDLPRHRRRSK